MSTVKTALWNAISRRRGECLEYLDELHKMQWLEPEELESMQQRWLRDLLCHAYNHIPYYHEALGGVMDGSRVDLRRFHDIPLLDKATIRSRFDDLKSDDIHKRKWFENTSGGSTGEPVRLIQDSVYHDWIMAIKLLQYGWSGLNAGDCQLRLWGSARDLLVGRETPRVRLARYLRHEVWINAFRMTPERMRAAVSTINRCKPRQILAYVGAAHELARLIEREGLSVNPPSSIMTSADVLRPEMRETIERVFRAPVFDRYGTREVGDIACECEAHNGLHISAPIHHVEILRPDGSPTQPGEVGEIVVTLLVNYSMPLIRYRIGDMASWSDAKRCPCGRNWPMLAEVSGRVTDVFVTKAGGRVPGQFFTNMIHPHTWISRFQAVQEDYDRVRLLIVCNDDAGPPETRRAELEDMRRRVRLAMGSDCRVDFEFVDDIPPTPSGKSRCTISKVVEAGRDIADCRMQNAD
ncbi:MAG: phenylacetate--CoA ligase family protein [Armatimonadetes bacterium]|nr:phenylacetate--CoA ligase family protein [Armatimonadota bacterium]